MLDAKPGPVFCWWGTNSCAPHTSGEDPGVQLGFEISVHHRPLVRRSSLQSVYIWSSLIHLWKQSVVDHHWSHNLHEQKPVMEQPSRFGFVHQGKQGPLLHRRRNFAQPTFEANAIFPVFCYFIDACTRFDGQMLDPVIICSLVDFQASLSPMSPKIHQVPHLFGRFRAFFTPFCMHVREHRSTAWLLACEKGGTSALAYSVKLMW